jgi:hypothetical protein
MSGYTWQLLDWFRENQGKSKTRLAINSNLGTQVDVDKLLKNTQGVVLDVYTSMEAVEKKAEYIRDGLVYTDWLANVDKLVRSGALYRMHLMCTINALCLDSLPELLTKMLEFKSGWGRDFPSFTLNILRFPSFQSPLVLPNNIRTRYKQKLENWLAIWNNHSMLHDHERNHVQRLIDYLDVVKTPHSDTFDLEKLRKDFKNFYTQYDQRRGKNFIETFPDLAEWYNTL